MVQHGGLCHLFALFPKVFKNYYLKMVVNTYIIKFPILTIFE